jgi:maleate cis-trans isomerase
MDVNTDHRVDGWRMKLGYINPTTVDYPNNYSKHLPEGVKMVAISSGASSFDRSNMSKARETRREAAQTLDEWGVDCIIGGGGPVSTLEGADAEDDLVEDIQAEVSVPFTTALKAQVAALRDLGAETLLAVTPFPDNRDEETKTYLEERGFDVAAIGGIDLPQPGDVRNLPPTTAYQCAKQLASQTDAEFDTIYVGCAPFGPMEYVERIERDTGYPVIVSSQAQMWKAFDLGGISPKMEGFGELFERRE